MDEHERHFIGDLLNDSCVDDTPYCHEPPPPYSPLPPLQQPYVWEQQQQQLPQPIGTQFVTRAPDMGGHPLLYTPSTPPPPLPAPLNMVGGLWREPPAQPDRVIIRNMERPAFAPRNNYAHIPVATVAPTATKTYSAVAQCHTPTAVTKPTVRATPQRKCSTPAMAVDAKQSDLGDDDGALAEAMQQSKLENDFKVNIKKGKKVKTKAQTFTAQRVEQVDDAVNPSRFQVLADGANRSTTPSLELAGETARAGSKGAKATKAKSTSRTATRTRQNSSVRQRRPNQNSLSVQLTTLAGYLLLPLLALLKDGGLWLHDLVSDLLVSTWEISLFACRRLGGSIVDRCMNAWQSLALWGRHVAAKFMYRPAEPRDKSWWSTVKHWMCFRWLTSADEPPQWGLPANIELPTTGEQAMQRLLTCGERDAYSILGLTADCTDEEIRRYYKRQAVLVHPDKNTAVGSDEAFKVLAAAFDVVGTVEARQQYNMDNIHKRAELAQLHQLMTQLKAKIDEALSTMHCDCGRRHKRYVVAKREVSEARWCGKCGEHHAAKDNDIWAESRYLGCLWYYFACIGGQIYDITEWAACSHNPLKHLKANSHAVQYRLMSTRQTSAAPPPPSSDAFVEHLLSRLAAEDTTNAGSSATYQPPMFPADAARPRRATTNRRRRK